MTIADIEASIDRGDCTSKEIYELADILRADKAAKKAGYEPLSEDDFERLDIVALLLSKLECADAQHYSVRVGGDEWRRFGDVFSKLRRIIESLKNENIIDHVSFALGGIAHYDIAERQAYKDYLYNQVRAILRKIVPATEEATTTGSSVGDTELQEEVNDLRELKAFIERDGFKAFWNNSKVSHGLKNASEENARALFMAFLRGARVHTNSTEFKEASEGAGFADVISIGEEGAKRLFELKVISDKHNQFHEGRDQLFDYICKEGLKIGYYLVFDARHPSKRNDQYEEVYYKDQKTIRVILIDIHQIAPTKKFKVQHSS